MLLQTRNTKQGYDKKNVPKSNVEQTKNNEKLYM